MPRFVSALPLRTNLFYHSPVILVLVAVISSVKCDDSKIKYAPEGCEKTATEVKHNCSANEYHTFSEEFFKDCLTRIQSYDVSLKDHPFNLKQICLTFPDLGSDKAMCVPVNDDNRGFFNALAVTLLIIVLLDLIGIGVMIYSCCFQKHPAPPPPPPTENLGAKPQPTIIMIQTGGAGGAAAKKDEEA